MRYGHVQADPCVGRLVSVVASYIDTSNSRLGRKQYPVHTVGCARQGGSTMVGSLDGCCIGTSNSYDCGQRLGLQCERWPAQREIAPPFLQSGACHRSASLCNAARHAAASLAGDASEGCSYLRELEFETRLLCFQQRGTGVRGSSAAHCPRHR